MRAGSEGILKSIGERRGVYELGRGVVKGVTMLMLLDFDSEFI